VKPLWVRILLLLLIIMIMSVKPVSAQAAARIVVDYAGCRMENTGHGWFIVSGSVSSSSLAWYAKVTGHFYDRWGHFLFNGSDFTDPPILSRYYASAFRIAVDSRMCDHVATYRLAVELVPDFGS
jgi:hypothetical protein